MSQAPIIFVPFQSVTNANGGLESLTHLLTHLKRERVVLAQREDHFTKRWRDLGCTVEILPLPPIKHLSGRQLLAYQARRVPAIAHANFKVASTIRRWRARVVHINDISAFPYFGLGSKAAGARLVQNIRDTRPDRRYGLRWRLARTTADELVLLSREMCEELDAGLPTLLGAASGANASFVYSGVDRARMHPTSPAERQAKRRELGMGDDEFVIGYVGVFNDKKNQRDFIVRALPQLFQRVPTAKVVFIGDFDPEKDAYAAECRQLASVYGKRCEFAGFTAHPESWYTAIDVLCLASRFEGLARAMIEALACGTPVVSFDVCSAREILEDHECGIVARQTDYAALTEGLARLHNPDLRAAMAERGARAARELFDPAAGAARYDAIYRRLEEMALR